MTDLHHYLVYFEPPKEISEKVEELNNLISRKYENLYSSYMDGEWFSHIAVYFQSPMPEKNKDIILNATKQIASQIGSFEAALEDFILGSSGYIFVDLDKDSKEKFHEIFKLFRENVRGLEGVQISDKYLEKWKEFSEKERKRVEETGRPYPYQAHISIVKLVEEKKNEEALEMIRDKSLKGYTFTTDKIKVLDYYNKTNYLIGEYELEG